MNAYISMGSVLDDWDVDPRMAATGELAPYVTSAVLEQTLAIYKEMAANGLAYKGSPGTHHIKVVSDDSISVVLSDCVTPDKSDPYVQYVVATGKSVAQTAHKGPFRKAITVRLSNDAWRVTSVLTDASKICTP